MLRSGHFIPMTVALLACPLVWGSAVASKPAPEILPVAPGFVPEGFAGRGIHAACTLGSHGSAVFVVNYLLPPDDRYYTLLKRSECSVPEADPVAIAAVRIVLDFPVLCSQPVEISIVGVSGDTSCRVPDTLNVLYPPRAFTRAGFKAQVSN